METYPSVSEQALPGELNEFSTPEDFEEKCYQSVQEYATLLAESKQLGPDQRQDENRIACALDQVIGQIRSHIKWARKRNIDTTDLERIFQ